MFQLQLLFCSIVTMGPRRSSAETQACHRSYIIAARRGVQHYVIKLISDLRQVSSFLRVLRFPPPIKTDRHDIT